MRGARRFGRTLPTIDSPKAKAGAQLFLTGARSLDGITAEWLANSHSLSAQMAEYMLTIARNRRERAQ